MSRRTTGLLLAAGFAVLLLLTNGREEPAPPATERTVASEPAATRPRVSRSLRPAAPERWRPIPDEQQFAVKRVAARVVEGLTRHDSDERVPDVLARVPGGTMRNAGTAARALHVPGEASTGRVRYPQLSGLTSDTAGVMVLVDHTTLAQDGRTRTVSRVVDVRLRRGDGGWALDRVAGIGGRPVPRPANLSPAARRALRHPRLAFSDSARWDIHRGVVDDALLRALARAADRHPLEVLVLRTGHPENVWATNRRSAHSDGLAADIHVVGGRLVAQRPVPAAALAVGRAFLDGGAAQLGGPWDLAPGRRSFTDPVHADHLHVQQTRR